MSEVWLTHPALTPAHDQKVLRAAIGTWTGSGWQVREDQSDPAPDLPDVPVVADPGEPAVAVLAGDEPVTDDPPTDEPDPELVTTKKRGG